MHQPGNAVRKPVVRRRGRSRIPLEKRAFSLHTDVIENLKAAVADGLAPNLSAFVEAAVIEKLQRSKRARLYDAYALAAKDPAFLADMEQVSQDFDRTASDGL